MTSALAALRTSLQRVVTEARFDLGRVISEYPGGGSTSYARREGEVIGPERLRELYEGAGPTDHEVQRARSARLCLPDHLKSDLAGSFHHALAPHHDPDSDCVGHAFPMGGDRAGASTAWPSGVYTHSEVSSIESFSATMTKWAAVLGVDPVTDLLAAWTGGEPLAYRTCAIVGLTLQKRIGPTEGVRITPLPLSTAELPSGLPKKNDIRRSAYLGQAVLSVDTIATPSLYRPVFKHQQVVRGKLPQGLDFDLICQAVSLECDASIDTGIGWNDYGNLNMLANDRTTWGSLQRLGQPWRSSKTTPSKGLTTIQLREGAAHTPSEDAINDLLIALKRADARTRVAVSRWKKSKQRHASLADGFIDLRIALESLFLPQTPDQQLKFRLATNGAWLVGDDGEDRLKSWHILRDAYDAASRAVHRGRVKQSDETKELLANAQMVCRRGILRVLRDGQVSDWNRLILDAPTQGTLRCRREGASIPSE